MSTVVITGCAGFIGSHLSKHYLDEGYDVVGVDDFSSSSRSSSHFKTLKKHDNFRFVNGGIELPYTFDDLNETLKHYGFSTKDMLILNFACPASPPRYQSMPVKTMDTCYLGTRNVLNFARDKDARIVHASTSEIYGDPVKSPQVESDWGNVNTFGPRSCYDEGKRIAETLCREFNVQHDVDVRLIRIFNCYGPNMDPDDGRVVTNFIKQALKGEKLTIYGTGTQTRSFCYVDDLVRGIVKLGSLPRHDALNVPINLGNPNEFSMIDLANNVLSSLDLNDVELTWNELPTDDPRQRKPDITKARELLNWEPKVQLNEGLQRTIDYVRSVL